MRQRETVKIDDREISIKELTVQEILDRMAGLEENGDLIEAVRPLFEKILEGITFEELKRLTPSDIKLLWEAFKRVNAPFFEALAWTGLSNTLETIRKAFMSELLEKFSSSLKPGIPGSGNTVGPGSSEPEKPTSSS